MMLRKDSLKRHWKRGITTKLIFIAYIVFRYFWKIQGLTKFIKIMVNSSSTKKLQLHSRFNINSIAQLSGHLKSLKHVSCGPMVKLFWFSMNQVYSFITMQKNVLPDIKRISRLTKVIDVLHNSVLASKLTCFTWQYELGPASYTYPYVSLICSAYL